MSSRGSAHVFTHLPDPTLTSEVPKRVHGCSDHLTQWRTNLPVTSGPGGREGGHMVRSGTMRRGTTGDIVMKDFKHIVESSSQGAIGLTAGAIGRCEGSSWHRYERSILTTSNKKLRSGLLALLQGAIGRYERSKGHRMRTEQEATDCFSCQDAHPCLIL